MSGRAGPGRAFDVQETKEEEARLKAKEKEEATKKESVANGQDDKVIVFGLV